MFAAFVLFIWAVYVALFVLFFLEKKDRGKSFLTVFIAVLLIYLSAFMSVLIYHL